MPADEAPDTINVEPRVAQALIVDQKMNGIADHGRDGLRQSLGEKWRLVILLAEKIGEQITERRKQAVVCHSSAPDAHAGFGSAATGAAV